MPRRHLAFRGSWVDGHYGTDTKGRPAARPVCEQSEGADDTAAWISRTGFQGSPTPYKIKRAERLGVSVSPCLSSFA